MAAFRMWEEKEVMNSNLVKCKQTVEVGNCMNSSERFLEDAQDVGVRESKKLSRFVYHPSPLSHEVPLKSSILRDGAAGFQKLPSFMKSIPK